ncbi:MAG: ABC transporter permease, partial [Calditrichaeota bacterium]
PDWVQHIALFLPATYVVEMLQGIIVRGEGFITMFGTVAILLVTGILAFSLNGLLFRWESTDPIRKDRLAIAVGTLTAVYLLVFILGPRVEMAKPPQKAGKKAEAPAVVMPPGQDSPGSE